MSVTPLAVQDNTFQDIVDIQRKQTELSQIMVSQQVRSLLPSSESPVFYGDAMEFPAFMTAYESLIKSKVEDSCERLYFLGQYTSGKAKELINGCLQTKSEGSYKEAKGLLKRQFGDPSRLQMPTSTNCLRGNQSEQTMAQLSKISLLLWTKQSLL